MPRRRAVTREQLDVLLALPATETELIRHWTLGAADLTATERRRGDPNQLSFALQLCAFRYPGRLLRPREAIPELALGFVAGQLGVAHDALATYAVRVQTRREQLGALRAEFGFRTFAPEHRRELRTWLLPVALGKYRRRDVDGRIAATKDHRSWPFRHRAFNRRGGDTCRAPGGASADPRLASRAGQNAGCVAD